MAPIGTLFPVAAVTGDIMPGRMIKKTATSPTRIDLAGGTLDIWPLNLLVDRALTLNVAIDLWATVVLEELPESSGKSRGCRAEIQSLDQEVQEVWEDAGSPPADTKLPLIAECVRFLEPTTGFRLTARCEAPAGSGLGGSSSLAVSLLGGLQDFLGRPILPPDEMIRIARDLEARVLRIPTGTQDHFAATFGGAAAIRYGPGRPLREPLPLDLARLASRLVLIYCGASRLSAMANWDMVRRAIDGEERTRTGFRAVAAIALEMRGALADGDLDAAAKLMGREWEERKRLSDKVTTPLIEKALEAARASGAISGKVCGAGGGGCVAFLCKEGGREGVERAMAQLSGDGVRLIRGEPTRIGLQLAG